MALLRPFSLVTKRIRSSKIIIDGNFINPYKQTFSKPIVQPILPNLICLCGKKTIAEELGIPEPPKKPLPGFFMYIKDNPTAYPNISLQERVKLLKEDWLNLNPATKATYTNTFIAHLKEYQTKHSQYLKSLTDEQKKQIKALRFSRMQERRLKRTRTAHQKELKQSGKPEHPGAVFTIFCKDISSKELSMPALLKDWKQLPLEKKEHYNRVHQELLDKYRKKLALWEKQMVESGQGHLLVKIPKRK